MIRTTRFRRWVIRTTVFSSQPTRRPCRNRADATLLSTKARPVSVLRPQATMEEVAEDDGDTANPTTPDPAPQDPQEPAEDISPERAIEEADVVKREGDRLYALSALGGLTIVDISNPDALTILGRHRSTATPFEMYVRDEVVFVLYNGYAEYLYDEDTETYTYYQTSRVIPLDTSNPESITEGGKFEVSGYIADSRLIGDVMYVVAYDDG